MQWVINFLFPTINVNHVITSHDLNMADETGSLLLTTFYEWSSAILKQGVVTIKNRVKVQYSCEETFGRSHTIIQ